MILPVSFRSDVTDALRHRAIAGTGHRPAKLLGYSPEARVELRRFVRA